ncbi:hypothetical protein [Krasilnikovia sp. MM14-A1259]|uniref:hypothetical protein n=1 Tax=Krasilnikovia sp. MM14-A1259 TaxID=3373539 RepID=UPI0037FFE941
MSDRAVLSRRQVLAGVGGVAAGLAFGVPAAARTGQVTDDGWPAVGAARITQHRIEGSDAVVALLPGPTAAVLLHVARRFHYEVDALAAGEATGYRGAGDRHHRSGTALELRPGSYPAGAAGNLYPQQLAMVRDILAECDGVVRWGGDDPARPMEGHFRIDVPPGDARLHQLVARLEQWADEPDQGAGVAVDPAAPDRRQASITLQRRQAGPR